MPTSYCFLLVSKSPGDYWCQALRGALVALGSLQVVSEGEMAGLLEQQTYDIVIVDAGAVTNAPEVVSQIHVLRPDTRVVVATVSPHWKIARAVLLAGATDYLYKSLNKEDILTTFQALLE
jgi:DNA-binding NarL/FixJ family response regulator